jgi:hypothetical protein
MGLPILDSHSRDLGTAIQQFANQFAMGTAAVLTAVDAAVIDIARIACVTCLIIGILINYTHVGRRRGKDLIFGGVALIPTECVVPTVTALAS